MNQKNYIISQRISYLVLGAVIGYFFAKNGEPLAFWMVAGFVIIGVGLSEWFKRRWN